MRERRNDLIELDPRLLSTMLEPRFPDAHVVAVQLLSDGFSNSNYHIRFAEPGTSVVLRLHAGEGIIDHTYTTAQKEWEIMHLLQQNQVAEDQERLIGFLIAERGVRQRNRHRCSVVIGILQAWTSQGIGTQLMLALEDWARNQGVLRLELTVMTHNHIAVALYQKRGFEIEGTLKRTMFIDGDYVDEHLMAKFLA